MSDDHDRTAIVDELSDYEALAHTMIERGLIDGQELARHLAQMKERLADA